MKMKSSCLGQESYKVGTSTSYKLRSKPLSVGLFHPRNPSYFRPFIRGYTVTPFTTGGPGAHLVYPETARLKQVAEFDGSEKALHKPFFEETDVLG